MSKFSRRFSKLKGTTVGAILTFFRAGRSVYVLICGLALLSLGAVVLVSSLKSREATAAQGGWETFVAIAGTNQWLSASFLIASAGIVLSINYLPRLEGEA
jgi:hypothetical protein